MQGDFMAPRKKTSRKKSNARAKLAPPPMAAPSPAAPSGGKYVFAIILVLLAIAIFNHFHTKGGGGDSVKPFKVRQLLRVAGEDYPCGLFTAWGIAPVGKDQFVVSDVQHGRLLYFDFQGKFLRSVGRVGRKRALDLDEPSGMCFDSRGNVYVTDTWGGAIKGFDANGKEVLNLDLARLGGFYGPRGCGFDGKNFVVADTGSSRVGLVSLDGTLVGVWNAHGPGAGQFKNPLDAAADGKGNYFIADSGNNRLQWLDSKGKAKKIFDYPADADAVCLDSEGRLYVAVDGTGSCVKVYDSSGDCLGNLADQNGSEDAFRGVRGISVSPDNVLMIAAGTTATLFKLPSGS